MRVQCQKMLGKMMTREKCVAGETAGYIFYIIDSFRFVRFRTYSIIIFRHNLTILHLTALICHLLTVVVVYLWLSDAHEYMRS